MSKRILIYPIIILGIAILSILAFFMWFMWQTQHAPQDISQLRNKTETFLGSKSMWEDIRIELKDMHELWGGKNIFIYGSGRTIIQVVRPEPEKRGLFEKRYTISLDDSEIRKLINTFIENDFVTIDVRYRMGIPDETMQKIILVNSKGEQHEIDKWERDKNEKFDQIYHQISLIQEKIENLTPVLERKWE